MARQTVLLNHWRDLLVEVRSRGCVSDEWKRQQADSKLRGPLPNGRGSVEAPIHGTPFVCRFFRTATVRESPARLVSGQP